jgi:membrane protease YdiL (CAAX protease family)
MGFIAQLAEVLILITGTFLWARWSRLDLGLRAPNIRRVWLWTLFFIAWVLVEQLLIVLRPAGLQASAIPEVEKLTAAQYLLLMVVLTPIQEELLFRGALFSALKRRWGSIISIAVPSFVWGLLHFEYGPWLMASIMGSGVVLAIIRWKSESIYLTMVLHAGANLLGLVSSIVLS